MNIAWRSSILVELGKNNIDNINGETNQCLEARFATHMLISGSSHIDGLNSIVQLQNNSKCLKPCPLLDKTKLIDHSHAITIARHSTYTVLKQFGWFNIIIVLYGAYWQ